MSRAYKIIVIASVILITGAIAVFSPMDMDTFLSFAPIACKYFPLAIHHHYTVPCDGTYDLMLPGGVPWTRSWNIQGVAAAIIYFPLYLLFPHWQSALVMDAVWLVAVVAAVIYSARISAWVATMVLVVNFYFTYTLLEDHQTGMQTAAIFFIPLLARKILQEKDPPNRINLNILLGMVLFFCIEFKLVFLYYLPIACILTVCLNRDLIANVWVLTYQLIRKCLLGLSLGTLLTAWLMNAQLPNGQIYWRYISNWGKHYPHIKQFDQYLLHLWQLVTRYIIHFPNAGAIVYGTQDIYLLNGPQDYQGVLLTAPFWCIYIVTMVRYCQTRMIEPALSVGASQKIEGFLLAGGSGLLVIASQTLTRHAFHLLPVMICLFAALAVAFDYLQKIHKFPWVLAYLLMASQLVCTAYVVRQPPLEDYMWERFDAIAFTQQPQIAEHAVVVNIDWGTYYISGLYGPQKQLVTYKYGLENTPELHRLISLAKEQGRYLVFIKKNHARGKFEEVREVLPHLMKLYPMGKPDAVWEVWGEPPILDYLGK